MKEKRSEGGLVGEREKQEFLGVLVEMGKDLQ